MFTNKATDKGLISEIYKPSCSSRSKQRKKETNDSNEKGEEDRNRHFSKEDIQRIKKHLKRCLKCLSEKCKSKLQ